MKHNVGKADRILRIIVGIVILGSGFYFHSWWGLIGIIPLFTAFLNWCPLYSLLGINTCKLK